tara:strand:+ start:2564 stop:3172 length:609 start_codon:yes stop_codon:yes gene_type:complete
MDCKDYKEAIALARKELRLLNKEKQNEVDSHNETLKELNTTKANYKEAIALAREELRLQNEEKIQAAENHNETLKELNAAKAEINILKEKNENMDDMDEGMKWLVRQYKQQSLSDKLTIVSLNAEIVKLRHKDLNPSARTEVKVPPTPTHPSNPALKSYWGMRDQEHGKRLEGIGPENIDKKLKDAEDVEDVKKGGLGNLRY